jgi:nucleoside-diphosphate-sugar epimerase
MSSARKNIIITGAGGLVGPLLASRLLNDPEYHLILTDLADPIVPTGVAYPENATVLKGDITSPAFVTELVAVAQPLHAVFIFHGIMSAGSEANFELSLKVNLDSVRLLADHLRVSNPGVRVIYASSQAVYGQPLPEVVADSVTATPEGTYGAHKLMNEIYLNELHRRGFLDVFTVRFPTISVRPGKPTAAASSFLSGIIREPMNGVECVVPIKDREFRSWMSSPKTITENLVRVLNMDSNKLPKHIRHINVPGVSVSVQQLLDALAKYGGEDKLLFVKEVPDAVQEKILRSWPSAFDTTTPVGRLGLAVDESGEDLVRQYIASLQK